MPTTYVNNNDQVRHTDDMQDIITTVPSWILRWGITLFFGILVLMVSLSAFIRYPDIVNAQLKIESPNSPKPVVSKVAGKLIRLLVKENANVVAGQALAYMESTGDHDKVMNLATSLKELQTQVLQNKPVSPLLFSESDNIQLGELQSAYQTFYQEYLNYKSAINDGFYLKKKAFLQNDLMDLTKQAQQLNQQKQIQQRNFVIADDDYQMHKKLEKEKVETPAELRQQESKYLAQKEPLVQTESALITANNNYAAKQKDILELDNQIREEKSKFQQALNSLISQAEDWKSKYVLTAAQSGKLSYSGIVQENQVLSVGQEVFNINPGNEAFFGQMSIPQDNMGKIKEGQEVLVKLKSYPFEEYGMIRGRIGYIADVPYKDSIFVSRVDFKIRSASDMKKPIHLKQGMTADAEIITQDATILQRLGRSVTKLINRH
ncbi:HlyD family secretion protein [Mucilaginibacter lappiensis]|uniref:HlyD family secretion protein n=1 Tax=Mucilaginibacter lappiensis TaxID=354630 RepID=A0ABR6PN45_9SPHI|nr:HlyD family efflux transporter periplasmic adaptor subunit [Mucilaginibacter lappiensis]MBB6111192.1 HlyD family secretion protein [Mucilaginibacter lappiensis]SIR72638.1 HlyD family secretion protein [Mucilaginibacter lappiensis]